MLLSQSTRFCQYAGNMLAARFRGRVRHETIRTYSQAQKIAMERGTDEPVMLIWGNGTMHHFSNTLNVPDSVKYVFDNHDDDNHSVSEDYDSHNSFSMEQGVIVRVCRKIDRGSRFSIYDRSQGNGLMHISIDLDFVRGFPALPWMSCGSTEIEQLAKYVVSLAKEQRLVRFDIGGYREMSEGPLQMQATYKQFYSAVSEQLLEIMST